MSLPLVARTQIARFVSVNERVIVSITRSLSPDAYADPPVFEQLSTRWGSCSTSEPDSFRELGSLEDALKDAAPLPMIAAAASASPRGFAEMVASAHELARVIAVGSFVMSVLDEAFDDARRYYALEVTLESLTFYTFEPGGLFGPRRRAPGVHAVSYSLARLCIERDELVAPYPPK